MDAVDHLQLVSPATWASQRHARTCPSKSRDSAASASPGPTACFFCVRDALSNIAAHRLVDLAVDAPTGKRHAVWKYEHSSGIYYAQSPADVAAAMWSSRCWPTIPNGPIKRAILHDLRIGEPRPKSLSLRRHTQQRPGQQPWHQAQGARRPKGRGNHIDYPLAECRPDGRMTLIRNPVSQRTFSAPGCSEGFASPGRSRRRQSRLQPEVVCGCRRRRIQEMDDSCERSRARWSHSLQFLDGRERRRASTDRRTRRCDFRLMAQTRTFVAA